MVISREKCQLFPGRGQGSVVANMGSIETKQTNKQACGVKLQTWGGLVKPSFFLDSIGPQYRAALALSEYNF